MALTLTSANFKEGATLGMEHVLSAEYGFGTSGGNKSPQLSWSGAPAGTKSFAVHCFDPDAPTGSGFWHWVVVNIPATVDSLAAGAGDPASGKLPQGALQVRTDFGAPGYGGPCPPPGKPHRYVFSLYALDIDKMDVPNDASGALVGFNIGAHTVGKAVITAQYGR